MAEYTNIALDTLNNALRQIKIGKNVYQIKDSRVDTLVTDVNTKLRGINTRVNTLENKKWTAVTNDGTQGAYATSVTQDANGQIAVTYSNVRSDNLTAGVTSPDGNGSSYTEVITGITQNTNGSITATSTTSGNLTAYDGSTTDTLENVLKAHRTDIQGAQTYTDNAIGGVIGAQGNQSSDNTIYGAKKYAEEKAAGAQTAAIAAAEAKVNELAGQDWSKNAKTVKNIIDELTAEGNTATEAMTTIADKLRDDFTYTPEGGSPTTSVKGYIDGKIAGVQSQATGGISDLDAEVTSTDGTNVQVKVTEVDGKITAVNVTTDNSINANVLANKVGEIGSQTVKAYVDEQIANKNVSASSSSTDYITAGAKNNAVTVAATQKLIDAVTAAEGSLAAAKVTKDNVAYCTSSTYTSNYEQLELTFATKDFVVPKGDWPNS